MEDLKLMQKHPRFYLASYFSDLKTEVDLEFALKPNEKVKYLEIINKIESIENEFYNKIKPFNEIHCDLNNIDEVKYNIEKKIFSNKSFMFLKDYGVEKETFLLIINDEYLRKSTFDSNQLDYFNREKLISYFLKQKLSQMRKTSILCVNIDIISQTLIFIPMAKINYINSNTFNGLINLKEINLTGNELKEIHKDTLNGLINLKVVNFGGNQIKELNAELFKNLTNLETIYFHCNEIKELNSNIFNGLVKLKNIYFGKNLISNLNENIFNGLDSLERISFYFNQIKELHPLLFNNLNELKELHFNGNEIKELNENTFHGLSKLKEIDFYFNKIKSLTRNVLNGLISLEKINFGRNEIKELDENIFKDLSNLEVVNFHQHLPWNSLQV